MNNMNVINYQQGQKQDQIFDSLTFHVLACGWVLYFFLSPIYIFKSGLPQPADMLMAIMAPLTLILFVSKQRIIFNRVFACLCLIVGLFFSINILNFYIYRDFIFLYSSAYYIFNALVFLTTVIVIKANPLKMRDMIRYVIIITLAMQFIVLKFGGGVFFREIGTFNNPNQFGYWSLLMAACLLTVNYGKKMPVLDIIAIVLCTYFITVSLSRAAFVSHSLILFAFFIGNYISWIGRCIFIIAVLAASLFYVSTVTDMNSVIKNIDVIERITDRLVEVQSDNNVVKERGYSRLFNYPQYLIYGAGEGAYWRFNGKTDAQHHGLELHSGLATILISYGLFGFILFASFIITIFQRVPLLLWLSLFAVMGYGITHQHIRFTGFWIYLGIIYGASRYIFPIKKIIK